MAPLETVAPLAFMAISSVLLDSSLPAHEVSDRLVVQTMLLLAVSAQQGTAQNTNDVVATCAYGTICFSMLHASLKIRAFPYLKFTQLLAPGSLVPLGVALVKEEEVSLGLMALSFLSSLAVLVFWQGYKVRQERLQQSLVGMPLAANVLSSSFTLDESVWWDWTPPQVLQWVALHVPEMSSCLQLLTMQQLDGSTLDGLDCTTLQSFGIPFGPSQHLDRELYQLTLRYPKPHTPQEPEPLSTLDDWFRPTTSSRLSYAEPPSTETPGDMDGFSPQMAERAKELMQERFGMNLPELRSVRPRADDTTNNPESMQMREATTAGQHTWSTDHATQDVMTQAMFGEGAVSQSFQSMSPPAALMDAMPPNIREIAMRRPDLVNKMLADRHRSSAPLDVGTIEGITPQPLQVQQDGQRYTEMAVHPHSAGTPQLDANAAAESLESKAASVVPSTLFDAMPPDIREIAMRRPDLVSKVLSSRIPPTVSEESLHSKPPHKRSVGNGEAIKHAGSPTNRFDEAAALAEEWDGDGDDESVSLLRKRTSKVPESGKPLG